MENIYNLSGKAGNKLYTQCIHKYMKTKNKTKSYALGKAWRETCQVIYSSLGGGKQDYFIFVTTFFISIVSQFSIANRRSFYNAKNKLYVKGFEWKLFGAVRCPLFVLSGLEEGIIWPRVRSHGVLLRLC